MKPPSPYCSVIAEVIPRCGSGVPARARGWKSGLRSAVATGLETALDRALDQADLGAPEVVGELPLLVVAAVPTPDRQRDDAARVVEPDPGAGTDPGLDPRRQLLRRGTGRVVDQQQ